MLLTRQQVKAKKRHARRLGQLLRDARIELDHNLGVFEDNCIEDGSWGVADIACSQDAHLLIGQILTIAAAWEELNHFEIEEKLSEIEEQFYPN